MFVTNGSSRRLTRLTLSIAYYDMTGRELHKVEVEKGVDIPPGATRRRLYLRRGTGSSHLYIIGQNAQIVASNIRSRQLW